MNRYILAFLLGMTLMFGVMGLARSEELVQQGWVNDFAKVLSVQQTKTIVKKLSDIEKNLPDAPQVVVVTYASLGDQQISELTIQTAKAWKIGRKERDNGILIAVAPKERKYFVAVGYGLEPVIPDAKTQIIGNNMRDALKTNKNDWNAAINAAVDSVEQMLPKQAYDPEKPIVKPVVVIEKKKHNGGGIVLLIVLFGTMILLIWLARRREVSNSKSSSTGPSANTGYTSRYSNTGYSKPSRSSSFVYVDTGSSSRSRDSSSSSSDSSSSWSSSSSSSDSGSSSSGSDYSSGGGDFGGGGGGGDL